MKGPFRLKGNSLLIRMESKDAHLNAIGHGIRHRLTVDRIRTVELESTLTVVSWKDI